MVLQACAGLPSTRKDHALAVTEMAEEMIFLMSRCDNNMRVRIGIHTGPVIAGVVGFKRQQFSLFGKRSLVNCLFLAPFSVLRTILLTPLFSRLVSPVGLTPSSTLSFRCVSMYLSPR